MKGLECKTVQSRASRRRGRRDQFRSRRPWLVCSLATPPSRRTSWMSVALDHLSHDYRNSYSMSNRTPQRGPVVTSQCARPRATPTRARPHSPLPASSRPRSLTLGTLLPLPPPSRHPSRRGKERDPYAPRPPATHASNAVTSLRCAGVLPRRGRRRRRRTPYPPRGGAFVVILM